MWNLLGLLNLGSEFGIIARKLKDCTDIEVHRIENGYNVVIKKDSQILLELSVSSHDYDIQIAIQRLIKMLINYLKK